MLENNEMIELSGGEAILLLKEVAYILISLDKIAGYYYNRASAPPTDETDIEYALETTRFIDQGQITQRLAKVRRIVAGKFDNQRGEDDMSDIEREMELLRYWEKPGD